MTKSTKTHQIFKYLSYIVLFLLAGVGLYLWYIGAFTDIKVLRSIVGVDTHPLLAPIIFFALQIFQILIPIIPGTITLSAGVVLFGPWLGFIYNYSSIVIGSTLAFLLVRRFGKKFVANYIDEGQHTKYLKWIEDQQKFTRIFAVAILLPGAPDDLLSMLAGLSAMRLRTFVVILLIAKPLSIAVYSGAFSFLTRFF
ncbi:TVP38/TMEM64 family protein [Periweissella fabalis]|uniref:TVP38/TMEM64 family membrane protein n=1 Tax=Periweissella fabalis TaxID=1070421 RepID=A0A7X6N5C7_9LACO|nr:VTT domain-containing protein [Periweissella fabalis]MCM0599673.1 TVP38/TMEM64 family protein [Periweissella fabalis]NKZ24914.1 TVP38/TMEM64 family protein [Periweissella fabalis]